MEGAQWTFLYGETIVVNLLVLVLAIWLGLFLVSRSSIRDFNQALLLDPNNSLVYLWRGMTYVNKGELENAIADFIKIWELCGGNAYLCLDEKQRLDILDDIKIKEILR